MQKRDQKYNHAIIVAHNCNPSKWGYLCVRDNSDFSYKTEAEHPNIQKAVALMI